METFEIAQETRVDSSARFDVIPDTPRPQIDPPVSFKTKWGEAIKQVAPLYVAMHVLFVVITGFTLFFQEKDFSPHAWTLHDFFQEWQRWDVNWYLNIAQNGYNHMVNTAFFPLYPSLIHLFTSITGHPLFSGMLVSQVAWFLFLVVFYQLVKEDFSDDRAHKTILYLSVFPSAFFFATAYTESLFLCMMLISFYGMRRGNWFLAGLFGCLAVLTRAAGILMIVPFLYEYGRQCSFQIKKVRWSFLWGGLIVGGLLGYMAYCYIQFHTPLAFSIVEGTHWNRFIKPPFYGVYRALRAIHVAHGYLSFQSFRNLLEVVPDLFILVFLIVGWIRWKRDLWGYLLIATSMYLFAQIAPVLDSYPLEAMTRYLLEVFPVFIILAGIRGKWFQYHYLLISSALLVLELTQFLMGKWFT